MRRLDALLRDNAELQAISGQASRIAELQKIWSDIVPQALRPYTRAGGLQHRRISVFADNGAVAAKLKMLAPGLLKSLQNKGLEVTAIRIEVQVKSTPRARPTQPRQLSCAAAKTITSLAESLPQSALRSVLERLAKKG